MNIYGDMRICTKCDMKADVVENGKDYCAECWWESFSNTGIKLKDYHKQEKENNIERTKSNKKKV
tara:strand:+ start:236 stop:430 length:195 start_codon:yes stop_codon:yes gene_type:complete